MKGFITFYLNYQPEKGQDINKMVEVLRQINKEVFDHMINVEKYQIVVVPTTNEACRIEKIDYDSSFPKIAQPNIDYKAEGGN